MKKIHAEGNSLLRFTRPADAQLWRPPNPPELKPGEAVSIDFEYRNGAEAVTAYPIGVGCYSPGRRQGWYLPFGHKGGGNLPEEIVKRWYQRELAFRDVVGLNIKAEMHVTRNWGLSPDKIGLKPHDVAYAAALLNENRYSGFSLEALAEEYLPAGERKVHPETVDPDKFWLAHAGEVAPRCISDCQLAWRIHEVTQPMIQAEDLQKVLTLEDACILPVVEMEQNGALLDRAKLEKWAYQVGERVNELRMFIYHQTGLNVNSDKSKDMQKLLEWINFHAPAGEKIPQPRLFDEYAKCWRESFGAEAIKGIKHPLFQAAYNLRRMKSLKSKYLDKYLTAIDGKNVLRYALHQLRSAEDEESGQERGTVTGRFNCGGGKYNVNIQQVMKCEKQIEELGEDWIIRELYIPAPGKKMGASDASQIEFRIFGHYSGSPMILTAYGRDPREDFHMLVTKMMKPELSDPKKLKGQRKHMKHNNFGVIYGMGRPKLARRLGHPCTCEGVDWNEVNEEGRKVRYFGQNRFHGQGCGARIANNIMDEYDQKFPEAKGLLKKASKVAEERGYVFTLLGRRRRFPDGRNLHKALNAIIQGSAADVFKLKLLELYQERKNLGITLRMPVHDEFVYDIDDPTTIGRVQELLDTQSIPLKVPLLWDTEVGNNWMEANGQRPAHLQEVLNTSGLLSSYQVGEPGIEKSGNGQSYEPKGL